MHCCFFVNDVTVVEKGRQGKEQTISCSGNRAQSHARTRYRDVFYIWTGRDRQLHIFLTHINSFIMWL